MKFTRKDQPRPLEYLPTDKLIEEIQSRFEFSLILTHPFDINREVLRAWEGGHPAACGILATKYLQNSILELSLDEDDEDDDE